MQTYFSTHEQMKHKMKTSSAARAWNTRRELAWKKSLEAEGYHVPTPKDRPEFIESANLVGQIILLHTDVKSVHTGIVSTFMYLYICIHSHI